MEHTLTHLEVPIYTGPGWLPKSFQQDVVAEFVDDHRLEYCMFVYLDAFLDTHRAKYPDLVDRWDPYAMYERLEQVYKGIRLELLSHGLLTNKAAGEYVMKRSQWAMVGLSGF